MRKLTAMIVVMLILWLMSLGAPAVVYGAPSQSEFTVGAPAVMAGMNHGQDNTGDTESLGYAIAKVVSVVAGALATLYYLLRIRWMKKASAMHLMLACMTLAMAGGLAGGILLALITKSFSLSSMTAAAAYAAAGYGAGRPHGITASLEGLLAGIMGGLMGGMTGYMSLVDYPLPMLIFADLTLVSSLVLLSALLRECEGVESAAGTDPDLIDEESKDFMKETGQKFVQDIAAKDV